MVDEIETKPAPDHRFVAVKLPCTADKIMEAGHYLSGWWQHHHGDKPHKVEADFTGGTRLSQELVFKVTEDRR